MEFVDEDGAVVDPATVEFSYTRHGRKQIGKEYPNPTPMEMPIGHQPYEPVWETIRRLVLDHARREKEAESQEEEYESEEEANDFDIGDDFDPSSPWEEHHEPTDPWPMSTAARQLEQAIAEKRNAGRIAVLQEELDALKEGKQWPPEKNAPAPSVDPPSATVKNSRGQTVGTITGDLKD